MKVAAMCNENSNPQKYLREYTKCLQNCLSEGQGQEPLFTSSPTLLVNSFSRLVTIINLFVAYALNKSSCLFWGMEGNPRGQKGKILFLN